MIGKKCLFGIVILLVMAVIGACDNSSDSSDLKAPSNPGHNVAFKAETIHTQQIMRTDWSPDFEYPFITVVSSKKELEVYLNSYKDKYNFDERGSHSPVAFIDAIDKYSDSFFANNFLVIILIEEGSGSIRHEVERIDDNGEIVIRRLIPEVVTLDMVQWTMVLELSKTDEKLEPFKITFIEEIFSIK